MLTEPAWPRWAGTEAWAVGRTSADNVTGRRGPGRIGALAFRRFSCFVELPGEYRPEPRGNLCSNRLDVHWLTPPPFPDAWEQEGTTACGPAATRTRRAVRLPARGAPRFPRVRGAVRPLGPPGGPPAPGRRDGAAERPPPRAAPGLDVAAVPAG
ncbi:hypothetical protein DEF23_22690 [Marinitenerispora sediminis]|nr:hypothetical protein DEF28_23445 [Marinitenerispora sediminis]RCV50044.1 hypothetical protein DEF23_22690 [Marinitenerispora sediminis]